MIKILIITGQNSYPAIIKVIEPILKHELSVIKAPVSVSAFLSEEITRNVLKQVKLVDIDIILLPGFIQWDTTSIEKDFGMKIRKGPEFASDLPIILKRVENLELSNLISADNLIKKSGENLYQKFLNEQLKKAKENLNHHTFYVNEERSELMIGRDLPPLIIAEIVNCTEKSDTNILKKVKHYINSGADIIDLGCVSNKPNPSKVKKIIEMIREEFDVLLSIDSMDPKEILAAVEAGIDLILSLDLGNHEELMNLPKNMPIVILPTNIKKGYFPKDPETRVKNLLDLTRKLNQEGFTKLIADPLLETPIAPGICNSLEAYFLYKKIIKKDENKHLELPLFFGVSNVVELMDIDSIGINGLLASIALELDVGVLFTVEHSTKLMGGVKELHESVKLNFVSKHGKTPPINQGLSIFRAKGKTSQSLPEIEMDKIIEVDINDPGYKADEKGYFKVHVDHYISKIYVLFFSNEHELNQTLMGTSAEALSKKIIELELTRNPSHLNYVGRELSKAEFCLFSGKPYIQDE